MHCKLKLKWLEIQDLESTTLLSHSSFMFVQSLVLCSVRTVEGPADTWVWETSQLGLGLDPTGTRSQAEKDWESNQADSDWESSSASWDQD